MKGICLLILIGTLFIGCRYDNSSFYPFDNNYTFHKSFAMSDYDTVMGECGFWFLYNKVDGSYYQFFGDEKNIVAKGFTIDLDEIAIDNLDDLSFVKRSALKFEMKAFDTTKLKTSLFNFKIREVEVFSDTTDAIESIVEMIDKNDSVQIARVVCYYDYDRPGKLKIIKQLRYFNGAPL